MYVLASLRVKRAVPALFSGHSSRSSTLYAMRYATFSPADNGWIISVCDADVQLHASSGFVDRTGACGDGVGMRVVPK